MPRHKTDRSKKYHGISNGERYGKPTNRFIVRKEYGSSPSEDTYLIFRIYKRPLSLNDKCAGFSLFINLSVADLYTHTEVIARRKAREIVRARFGKGMSIKFLKD